MIQHGTFCFGFPNQVTHVPTYEEMLAWAEETDKRIAAGELPPLGSRPTPSAGAATAAGDNLLSDQEQAQVCTAVRPSC